MRSIFDNSEVDFSNNPIAIVTVSLATGVASGPDSGNDTLIGIENVHATGHNNLTLIGSDAANRFQIASVGTHNISAGGGDDIVILAFDFGTTVDGGAGDDLLILGRTYERVGNQLKIATTPIIHTFTPGVSGTLVDRTSYSNFEDFSVYTGEGDDIVTFNQPHRSAWNGHGGNETVIVDMSSYSVSLDMLGSRSTIDVHLSFYIGPSGSSVGPAGLSNVLGLYEVENYRVTGGSAGDHLTAGAGNDVFTGGGGNDILEGNAGDDLARYSGLASQYQITPLSGFTVQVKDLRPGSPDGTDTLINIEKVQWSDGSYTQLLDSAPVVTAANVQSQPGQALALSSLFSVSDADDDPVIHYQVIDATSEAGSGYFLVNGVAQSAGTVIDIPAAQLGQVSFVTGTSDYILIRAFDGTRWSEGHESAWPSFLVSVPNTAPVAFTQSQSGLDFAPRLTAVPITQLIGLYDFDGDPITRIQLRDATADPASGHFRVNGVDQPAGVTEITFAQLAQTFFVTRQMNDTLDVRAFDGIAWSAPDNFPWRPFQVIVPANNAPVVTPGLVRTRPGKTLALSSLISASDYDGDGITKYQLLDASGDPDSGHFVINGVAQSSGSAIDITAPQLSQASFVAGSVGDDLQIRAFDGLEWSAPSNGAWSAFTITVPDGSPMTDLSGDGNSDILWQHDSGQAGVWLMDGTAILSNPYIGTSTGLAWHVIGSGDFDGDGKSDMLWQATGGQAGIWFMDGAAVLDNPAVGSDPGPAWRVIAAADLDGNGKSDIIWQHSNGQAGIWLMDGQTMVSNPKIGITPNSAWHVVATGDMDGNGKSDLVWRSDFGPVGIWFMDGETILDAPVLGAIWDTRWKIVAAGDFDADGKSGLLWQYSDGHLAIWTMDGANISSMSTVGYLNDPNWICKGTADLNGDGYSDILLQNTNGQAAAWMMQGGSILSQTNLGANPGTSWHVVANPSG